MTEAVALIVAAGKGVRAGGDVPKQFSRLGGEAVIARAIDAFGAMPVHVVVGEGQRAMLDAALAGRTVAGVTIGGAERQDSVRAGLAVVASGGATRVLIHDAARPLLPAAVIGRLLAALIDAPGAVPVLPVADSLAKAGEPLGEAVDRSALIRVQTPQAFDLAAIVEAHARWSGPPATDDAQVARAAGHRVVTVAGDALLDKITAPEDFARVEAMVAARTSRSAIGFDVHRLETCRPLWLGGVEIAHDRGLAGHSDADVALHALTDALLGTIAAGDIGSHFPPSDPQWRGAASHRFLDHARLLVEVAGGRIDHADVTIICEAPKIGPHRDAMRAVIAAILRVPMARISVKATTTEGLGMTGRGEGIAAQAIVTASFWPGA